ncbi:MAG: OmpA family protein [Polyangiaceae bacterium]|nr:OmpA family protein [Polyangiaceae bacterium]
MSMARWPHRLLVVAVGLTGALCAGEAFAQETETRQVDLPKFNPAPAGDRFFGVPSPYAAGDMTFHAMVMLDYAREPLVLVRESDDETEDLGAVVSDQMFIHVGLNFSILSRIAISASMPFAVLSQGDAPSGGTVAFAEPEGAAVGDLRLGARFRLFGEYHDPFQIGIGGYFWMPTGFDNSYVSDGSFRAQPQLLMGGRADRFIWSVMAGPTLKTSSTDLAGVQLGHQMNWGAGIGVLLLDKRTLQIHAETSGGVDVQEPDARSTNAEIIAGLKWRLPSVEFLELGLGAGPGLTTGIGTPAVRGVFQFAYTPVIEEAKADSDGDGIYDDVDACPKVPGVASDDPAKHGCPPEGDRDKDTILDKVDACPDEPGKPNKDPKKHGCPDRDTDKDGILDEVDACPNEPGVASDDPKKNGCPVHDKDGDGVIDEEDACIDIPGVKTTDPKTNGCPPDTDGDGFRDDQDACPKEKGVDDPDPSKRGCPKLVRFTDKEIVILEQVQFDFGKATIKAVSNPLLDSVAQVLKEHPEVLKVEVQGHTDNKGAKALNQKLSEARAKSVMEALVKRGLDASRLESKGYGMDQPLEGTVKTQTDAQREKNRRVQFIVKDKKPVAVEEVKKGVAPSGTPAPAPAPAPAPKPKP